MKKSNEKDTKLSREEIKKIFDALPSRYKSVSNEWIVYDTELKRYSLEMKVKKISEVDNETDTMLIISTGKMGCGEDYKKGYTVIFDAY